MAKKLDIPKLIDEFETICQASIGMPATDATKAELTYRVNALFREYNLTEVLFTVVRSNNNFTINPLRPIDELVFHALLKENNGNGRTHTVHKTAGIFRPGYVWEKYFPKGLTFEECTVDFTLPCFAEGQKYVALSRVKTPEGLTIIIKK